MMPHVDDGTLHALLDGALRATEPERARDVEAHLETCADCRARLDAAAEVRDRADGILGALDVPVTPDFEEVLVRAGAAGSPADRRNRLRRQGRWTRGLAWAASVVIALGTGYLIRDQVVPVPAASVAERADRAPSTAGLESADAAEPVAGRDATMGADAPEPVTPDVPERIRRRAERTARGDRPATPLMQEAPQAVAAAPAPSPPVRDAEDASLTAADGGVPEPRVELAAAEDAAGDASKALQSMSRVAGFVALPADDSAGFRSVAAEDVAQLAGTPLAVLPDAEVLRTLVRVDGTPAIVSIQRVEQGVVRVTQRTAAVSLENIVVTGVRADAAAGTAAADSAIGRRSFEAERRAPREAAAAAPPPAAADQPAVNRVATVGVIGWELILEGPLPEEVLDSLAAAARENWLRALLERPNP